MKQCGRCKILKEQLEFSEANFNRSGGTCKLCTSKYNKQYRDKNIDRLKGYDKKRSAIYYANNKENILCKLKNKLYSVEQFNKRKVDSKKRYIANKTAILIKSKEYRKNNASKIRNYHRVYYNNKRQTDIKYRIKCNISANISFYLKSKRLSKNKNSVLKYLNYTISDLISNLESKFEPWMTWNNYGKYDPKIWKDDDLSTWTWQIDHIIPHSTFNYKSMDDDSFKLCWGFDNLRPYSSKENFYDGINRTRHNIITLPKGDQ